MLWKLFFYWTKKLSFQSQHGKNTSKCCMGENCLEYSWCKNAIRARLVIGKDHLVTSVAAAPWFKTEQLCSILYQDVYCFILGYCLEWDGINITMMEYKEWNRIWNFCCAKFLNRTMWLSSPSSHYPPTWKEPLEACWASVF